jgi:glycosyltransferase involved in cell wall biosynthesis
MHVIDTTGPGGAETIFLELAEMTKQQGCQTVALIRGPGWVESQLKLREINYQIEDCKGSFNISYLISLIKLIRTHKIDLIQTHLFGSAIYGCMAGFITRTPVVCTFHGMVDVGANERFLRLKRGAVRLGADRLVTVTDQLYNKVKSLKLQNESHITTIYNGIDLSEYPYSGDECFRAGLDLKGAFVVGSLGNIRKPKNYALAIETIYHLHQRGITAHYLIAGQGNETQLAPIKQLITKYNLQNYVHILGFVDNVPQFLASLDVFLMSSSSEGHPLAITQAMASSLAIVSTPSGVQEIVTNEREALISAEHSAEQLANNIVRCKDDSVLAKFLGEQARIKAVDLYSLDAMTSQYNELYKNL